MARQTGSSETYEMRVPKAELADWRRRAAALSISVAELIRLKMRQGDEPVAQPLGQRPPDPSSTAIAKAAAMMELGRVLSPRSLSRQQVEPRFKASAKVKP